MAAAVSLSRAGVAVELLDTRRKLGGQRPEERGLAFAVVAEHRNPMPPLDLEPDAFGDSVPGCLVQRLPCGRRSR